MSQCEVISPATSTYNAVNIRINNPRANVSDKLKQNEGNGEFNAVNLEINNPELRQKPIYSYPKYDTIVTSDMANISPMDVPPVPLVPVAYKTSFINNRTYISTDMDTKDIKDAEVVEVPEPNITTTEKEKKLAENNPTFNGLTFKAASDVNIVQDANIKPAVDIEAVINNLSSPDYDVQAAQMEKIVGAALKDKTSALPYITTSVFTALIDIARKDSVSLEGPNEEQIAIRKKIITNAIIMEQQVQDGKKPEEVELPYTVSQEEFAKAIELSPMEMSERNREYALYTLAALSRVYSEEYENKTGNVVPLTDLPGASVMADILRADRNPSAKVAAIESLMYIYRPEYKDEISGIMEIASTDSNKTVAMVAADALRSI